MPAKPSVVYLPEMALTLVRRVSSRLPYNHFLFRTTPKWTKLEIKEYLEKVYGVKVARIATSISMGACKQSGCKAGAPSAVATALT
jgi:ribosomal protein L23